MEASGGFIQFALQERIYNLNPVHLTAILHIFREKDAAASLFGRTKDQSIPKRKPVKPVQVDSSQNIRGFRSGNIELGEQFDFSARYARVNAQLACDRNKIFLEHLQQDNPGSPAPVFGHKIDGASLLSWRSHVVRIYEHIRIEETTSAHESHFD